MSRYLFSIVYLIITGLFMNATFAENTDTARWTASWIWNKRDNYACYNDTIEARKEVTLPAIKAATLRITADTSYRLLINGEWVADGPSRSWPEHYQYDVIPVAGFLKEGENTIHIIAKFYGIGTFHQIPVQAGLLAQLDVTASDGSNFSVGTDESWQVRDAVAWIQNTPKQSVQMGPFEIYDARQPAKEFVPATVLCKALEGPWKNFESRDCPFLSRIVQSPAAVHAVTVVEKLPVKSFIFPTTNWLYGDIVYSNNHVAVTGAYATVFEVDTACEVLMNPDANQVYLDGKNANGKAFHVEPGRHLLYFVLSEPWGHWRHDSELIIHCEEAFRLSHPLGDDANGSWCFIYPDPKVKYRFADYAWALLPVEEQARIEKEVSDCITGFKDAAPDLDSFPRFVQDKKMRTISDAEITPSPHYLFENRKVLSSGNDRVVNADALLSSSSGTIIKPSEKGDIEIILDFGTQNVGYYSFELHAEEGLILDLFGVEYIAPDGAVQHTERYRNGMRYICSEGDNTFLSLNRRSQRYLFLTFRNQTREAVLKNFKLIESTYPVKEEGHFACSDEGLNRIWQISAYTLKLCMEDVFTDCPLYEQTLWVGDSRNEALFGYTAFGSADIAKRCIKLAAHSLDHHPMVLAQVPTTWETIIPVWSFLWNIMIRDYYEFTKDKDFMEWAFPYAMKNLRNAAEYADEKGLFSAPFWNMFDWSGIDDRHNTVLHNSMFMVGAIDATAKIAQVLGQEEDLAWLKDRRSILVNALNALWQEDAGAYPDSIHADGKISPKYSQHTAFLSLLFDIAEDRMRPGLLAHLMDPPENMTRIGSPFAILYLFSALEKEGLGHEVIQRIRSAYQPMLDIEATTVWETFAGALNYKGAFPTRSHTHAWSSAPVHFLNRIILGIVSDNTGCASFTISPDITGLTWASGSTACYNKEPVSVSWTVKESVLEIKASGPDGVDLHFKPNDSHGSLEIVFNGTKVR